MAVTSTSEISLEELRLAGRNHALPLEALRHDITPVGLHYLLIHFDIPSVDAETWRLDIGGLVERPLALTLDELKARPSRTLAVTLECAGNGRALLAPRPISQPWLQEAVGTAEWTGTPLAPLLREAGLADGAREVVFTGLDRGVQGELEHDYARSLPVEEALRDEVLLAYAVNGQPLPPQHGFPLRLVVPGWYGMASVKWLGRITVLDRSYDGYQQRSAYRLRQVEDEDGEPLTRLRPRALMVPPGVPEFMSRRRILDLGRGGARGAAGSVRVERLALRVGRVGARGIHALLPRPKWRGGGSAARGVVEPRRLREQRGPARAGDYSPVMRYPATRRPFSSPV